MGFRLRIKKKVYSSLALTAIMGSVEAAASKSLSPSLYIPLSSKSFSLPSSSNVKWGECRRYKK
jgi:hypothetical protein